MKKEANFQTKYNHWCKEVFKTTHAHELKQTSTALAFDAVAPHQIEALKQARHGVLVYKIPDIGYQNPFDGFCLASVPAYVVIKYPSVFHLIDIDTFLLEKSRSKRRSLTQVRARELANISVNL